MRYITSDGDSKERKEDIKFIVVFVVLILIAICSLIATIHMTIKQNDERKQEAFDNPPTLEIVKKDFGRSFFIGDDLLNDYITVVKYDNNFKDAAIYFIIDNRPFLKETRYYQVIYLVYKESCQLPMHFFYEWKNADKYIQMTEDEYVYYTQNNEEEHEQ